MGKHATLNYKDRLPLEIIVLIFLYPEMENGTRVISKGGRWLRFPLPPIGYGHFILIDCVCHHLFLLLVGLQEENNPSKGKDQK